MSSIKIEWLPVCTHHQLTPQNKAGFSQCLLSMCTDVIYSDTENSRQLYSRPPQPLFTSPANHHPLYSTHRITIMITKITTHMKYLYCCWEYEWVNEWLPDEYTNDWTFLMGLLCVLQQRVESSIHFPSTVTAADIDSWLRLICFI